MLRGDGNSSPFLFLEIFLKETEEALFDYCESDVSNS
tara:strand:- start:85 stop:195 length:111 start_codon:yes stop_codon:yes gene_type:complete